MFVAFAALAQAPGPVGPAGPRGEPGPSEIGINPWWMVLVAILSFFAKDGKDALISLWKTRHEQVRVERTDAIGEWREIVNLTQLRVDQQQTQLNDQAKKIEDQDEKIFALLGKNAQCEKENAEMRGEIRLLQSSVQRLQTASGTEMPSMVPATIIAGLDGIIRAVSPGVSAIFHWLPGDLIRKNLEMLIPERLREQHRTALTRVRESGKVPWQERAIVTYGLTQEGDEIPITVMLTAWQTGSAEWMVSAELRRRVATGTTKVELVEVKEG